MILTQLPQHILQSVVAEAIDISHLRDAFSLRLVCKQFDREVLHAVFDKDNCTLLNTFLYRDVTPVSSDIGKFRLLRGFIIRHNHIGYRLRLWQQLDAAVTALSHYAIPLAASRPPEAKSPSPDRFLTVHSHAAQKVGREQAIALVCDAVLVFLNQEIDLVWLLCRSIDDDEDVLESLEHKTKEFWLMAVASRWQDLELFRTAVTSFGEQKEKIGSRAWVDNLADALRIPAQEGFKEGIELVLAQDGIQTQHINRRNRDREDNAMEVAVSHSQLGIARLFLAQGLDLVQNPADYTKSLRLALTSTKERLTRCAFIDLFMSLTEEWQSKEVTGGIIEALCMHGDIETIKLVVEKFQSSAEEADRYQWVWEIFPPDAMLVKAVKSKNTELVRYLFDNKIRLSSLLGGSFSTERILDSVESAISEKNADMLDELFKEELTKSIMKQKLFLYAAITSNVKILEILLKDVDLNQKFDDDHDFWDHFSDGSRLSHAMCDIRSNWTPYLLEPGLLTLGTISLLCAIKSCNLESTRWLLGHGERLGRRYIECSRFLYLLTSSLVLEDESLIHGKGRIYGFTLTSRWPLSIKQMLEDGAAMTTHTLVVTRGRSQAQLARREIKAKINNKTYKHTKLNRFLDRFRLNFQTTRKLIDADARVVFGMEVPNRPYMDARYTNDDTKYTQMSDLLHKHRHPNIYVEY